MDLTVTVAPDAEAFLNDHHRHFRLLSGLDGLSRGAATFGGDKLATFERLWHQIPETLYRPLGYSRNDASVMNAYDLCRLLFLDARDDLLPEIRACPYADLPAHYPFLGPDRELRMTGPCRPVLLLNRLLGERRHGVPA